MAEQCYDLMITGIKEDESSEAVIKRLSSLCEKDDRLSELAIREAIFLNKKVRIFYNFSYTDAMQKKAILEQCGLVCILEPVLSLVEKVVETPKYTCPACGHIQEKSENDSDICDQCGVVGAKYDTKRDRDNLVELEKAHINTVQEYREEDARKEEERKFREQERKKIRKQLGAHSAISLKQLLIGASLTLSALAATALAYFIYDNEHSEREVVENEHIPLAQSASKMNGSRNNEPVNRLSVEQMTAGYSDKMVAQTPINSKAIEDEQTLEQAIKAADGIKDATTRAETLSTLASKQAKSGDSKSSEQVFARALETLQTAKNDTQRHAILEAIAKARIDTGNIDKALQIALKIDKPYQRSKLLIDIAQAQFAAQNWKAAEQTLARITRDSMELNDPGEKAQILSSIAKLYAITGNQIVVNDNFSLALENANQIEDPSMRVSVLCTIAKDQVEADKREASGQTIANAERIAALLGQDDNLHADALHTIALTRASIGDFHQATEVSDSIKDAYMRAKTLKEIAELEILIGKPDSAKQTLMHALEATRNITDVEQRMDVLNSITNAQIKANES